MRVSATDFAKNFGRYKDEARDEPIEVTSHDRTAGFYVSAKEYLEFKELRAKARQTLIVGALSESVLDAIRSSEMSPDHDHLNTLLGK